MKRYVNWHGVPIGIGFPAENHAWVCRLEEAQLRKEALLKQLMLSLGVWTNWLQRWMQQVLVYRDPAGWYVYYWPICLFTLCACQFVHLSVIRVSAVCTMMHQYLCKTSRLRSILACIKLMHWCTLRCSGWVWIRNWRGFQWRQPQTRYVMVLSFWWNDGHFIRFDFYRAAITWIN